MDTWFVIFCLRDMLKPGTIIGGKYQIRHLLADGGMSEVYLGESYNSLAKGLTRYALKRLLPERTKNVVFARMFADEAKLAVSLCHQNIVRCYDFVRENGNLFMVMELIAGKELGRMLPAVQALPLPTRLQIVAHVGIKVCEALDYIHTKTDPDQKKVTGFVHGDLSPQNVMISKNGQIKLYDFGAARPLNSSIAFDEDMVNGNLRYMSPEQLGGKNTQVTSDIYSLCLVLLEMLDGDLFLDRSRNTPGFVDASLHRGFSRETCQTDCNLHDAVRTFFNIGLSFDINKRFSTAKDMLTALKMLVAPLPILSEESLLRNLVTKPQKPALRQMKSSAKPSSINSLWKLLLLIAGFGLSIWIIIAFGVSYFEPRLRHNLPYWSQESIEHQR